jgi:hypothetical protein
MTQNEIIEAIKAERERQVILHPMVARKMLPYWASEKTLNVAAEGIKEINNLDEKENNSNWYTVFIEELYETFSETDPAKIKEEAIQLAALCVRLCETL